MRTYCAYMALRSVESDKLAINDHGDRAARPVAWRSSTGASMPATRVAAAFVFVFSLIVVPQAGVAGAQETPTCAGEPATIVADGSAIRVYGTDGDDVIVGSPLAEVIWAGAGNDIVCDGGEADQIFGEAGNDTLYLEGVMEATGIYGGDAHGGTGDDVLIGGPYNDRLYGRARDCCTPPYPYQWDGNDTLIGNGGDDSLDGQEGQDRVQGGAGNDRVNGGSDADSLFGGSGNDSLDDSLDGGSGADALFGGSGHDRLASHDGNDSLDGGRGKDTAAGWGAGGVTIDLPNGRATIAGETDTLIDLEKFRGTWSDDTFIGDAARNIFVGRGGDDVADGHGGNDTLRGGRNNDTLRGGQGEDHAQGGRGADHCVAETQVNCEN